MRRLLRNWQLKLLAVFLAATTWSVVAYAGNPPESQPFKGITVDGQAAPADLVLVKPLAPVTITVRGLQSRLASFRRESLHASIDMSGARRGANLLPVKARVDSQDHSVVLASVDPANVDVELDRLSTVQRRVDIRTTGSPNSCCALGARSSSPDTVTLRGPEKQLETAVAYVVVDVAGRGAGVQQTQSVQVAGPGSDRRPLPLVVATPAQVSVSIQITAVKGEKPAGINVVSSGLVAAGFEIVDIQLSPSSVEIEADPGILATVKVIDTDPVSIGGATSDVVAEVGLRPPAGVTVLTKGPFTVHFVIKPNPQVQPTPSPRPSP